MKKFRPKVMKTETNKNDKSDDGDGLDAVQPDVTEKFKDRKDKDIDNDGDVDDSDGSCTKDVRQSQSQWVSHILCRFSQTNVG